MFGPVTLLLQMLPASEPDVVEPPADVAEPDLNDVQMTGVRSFFLTDQTTISEPIIEPTQGKDEFVCDVDSVSGGCELR